MIKLPKEVSGIIRTLEAGGFKAYCVGGCVRDSLLGITPIDWDISTNALLPDLQRLFPEAKVISEKYSVIRIDHTCGADDDEGIVADIATFRTEGAYTDFRRPDEVEFVQSIREDLARRDFTINALADNPNESLVDLYGGREDIKGKLIRTVGEPGKRFQEDPSRMLRAIRLASELGFDLHKSVYEAILAKSPLMEHVSRDKIKEEFERIISSDHAGKGLRMLAGTDLMPFIIGKDIALAMKRREMDDFSRYCDNIGMTKNNALRRLGLFYLIFEGKRCVEAASNLPYSKEEMQHFEDQVLYMHKIYFMRTKIELKSFISKVGMDRYLYLHNLAKAQRIVYDQHEDKIMSRELQMKEIMNYREPIFLEDLVINGDDLIEAGIARGEKVGELLEMVLDAVHRDPRKNERTELLKLAKTYEKNWIKRSTRNIKWLR